MKAYCVMVVAMVVLIINTKCGASVDDRCDAKTDANNGSGVAISGTRNNEKGRSSEELIMSRMMDKLESKGKTKGKEVVSMINGCRGSPCNSVVAPCQLGCVCVPINFLPFGICSGSRSKLLVGP
ncbi:unnamed protein product [Malus baccata var. baccata]